MLRRTLLSLPTTLMLLLGLALPAEAQPRCETSIPVGKVRVCDDRRAGADPTPTRVPRAWQPAAPRPVWQPSPAPACEAWPAPAPAPATTPTPAPASAPTTTRGPAAWRQPTTRVVPAAWREALPPHRLLESHRRLREATDRGARAAVIDEVARCFAVTVDQVLCLVGALPPAERLAALTALHPATTDASAYHRTYGLVSEEERDVLHVRITRTFDAETAARRQRLQRLTSEERRLQRLLR